eukprot:3423998-Amphidinium_carterae.4
MLLGPSLQCSELSAPVRPQHSRLASDLIPVSLAARHVIASQYSLSTVFTLQRNGARQSDTSRCNGFLQVSFKRLLGWRTGLSSV